MELYFFRHGDAEEAGAEQTDYERRLTERGEEETRRIATALGRAGVAPDRIVSTSLVRAQQTAEILRDALRKAAVVEGALPAGTSLADVQGVVANGGRRIVFVGHAPYMSQVAGQLIGVSAIELGKSGCARVDTATVAPGAGRLVWLITPELFG